MVLFLFSTANASHLDILNNSCIECHKILSPFTEEESRVNEIRIGHIEKNISCSLECHADVIRRAATDNYQQWSQSEHAEYFVTCDACHGGDATGITEKDAHEGMKNGHDPESPVYFKNIPDTCGKCHAEEIDHFKNTMHYQRLSATASGPSCTTCHNPHSFKVLNPSELTALCSTCHNVRDQVATSSVPKDAKAALQNQKELEKEVLKARIAIDKAKAAGEDVSSAELDLAKAEAVLDDIPSLWHGFNLKNFDLQVQDGFESAKKAEYKALDIEPPVSSPFPGVLLIIGIVVLLIYIIKR